MERSGEKPIFFDDLVALSITRSIANFSSERELDRAPPVENMDLNVCYGEVPGFADRLHEGVLPFLQDRTTYLSLFEVGVARSSILTAPLFPTICEFESLHNLDGSVYCLANRSQSSMYRHDYRPVSCRVNMSLHYRNEYYIFLKTCSLVKECPYPKVHRFFVSGVEATPFFKLGPDFFFGGGVDIPNDVWEHEVCLSDLFGTVPTDAVVTFLLYFFFPNGMSDTAVESDHLLALRVTRFATVLSTTGMVEDDSCGVLLVLLLFLYMTRMEVALHYMEEEDKHAESCMNRICVMLFVTSRLTVVARHFFGKAGGSLESMRMGHPGLDEDSSTLCQAFEMIVTVTLNRQDLYVCYLSEFGHGSCVPGCVLEACRVRRELLKS